MTLREQCEAFCLKHHLGAVVRDDDNRTTFVLTLADVQRFARQQQAVGLREAAEEARRRACQIGMNEPLHTNHVAELRDWCEQQAREREGTP